MYLMITFTKHKQKNVTRKYSTYPIIPENIMVLIVFKKQQKSR